MDRVLVAFSHIVCAVMITSCSTTGTPGIGTSTGAITLSSPAPVSLQAGEQVSVVCQAPAPAAPKTMMNPNSWFYRDVSAVQKSADSDRVIGWLSSGSRAWGEFRIDLSLKIVQAGADAPLRTFTKTSDWWPTTCDYQPVPVPAVGSVEANPGYACADGGDCHLLVFHQPTGLLYEQWRANIKPTSYSGGCLAVWDSKRDYGMTGRGLGCTSADAAGFPIAPLLFTSDEVAGGEIRHALRFAIPNSSIRRLTYVPPATNSTPSTSGPADAPAYGAQLRLKASFDTSRLRARTPGALAIVRALQRYGMYLADGTSGYPLTGEADTYRTAKWCDHSKVQWCDEDPNRLLHEYDLVGIKASDFELIDHGAPRQIDGPCTRL